MISILMPVRNAALYLDACIQSVRQQTETNWELIAVDDHSDDQSFEALRQYAEKDDRIQALRNDGRGIIPALRKAFAHSKGRLITRMDADDRMAPHKLHSLRQLLMEWGPGHVATGMVTYFSEGELGDGFKKYARWLNDLNRTNRHYEEIYRECVIPSPCWMVWRDDLVRCGAFDPEVYPEDYDLCFRFYREGLKIVSSPDVLHFWRDHPQRASRNLEQYADQTYFDLKIEWFLKLDYDPTRPLVLWGAGRKGKRLARQLSERAVGFRWVCDTPSKWGAVIAGRLMEDCRIVSRFDAPQIIVAVSSPAGQKEIRQSLHFWSLEVRRHYFFFC
jgi:glycosyltransferase involved in cell wall biosynthesis